MTDPTAAEWAANLIAEWDTFADKQSIIEAAFLSFAAQVCAQERERIARLADTELRRLRAIPLSPAGYAANAIEQFVAGFADEPQFDPTTRSVVGDAP